MISIVEHPVSQCTGSTSGCARVKTIEWRDVVSGMRSPNGSGMILLLQGNSVLNRCRLGFQIFNFNHFITHKQIDFLK